jgi:hypothetical protein
MKDTTKLRAMYWGTIVGLICWITFQNERIERYKYAEKFLRSDIWHLQKRLLGL